MIPISKRRGRRTIPRPRCGDRPMSMQTTKYIAGKADTDYLDRLDERKAIWRAQVGLEGAKETIARKYTRFVMKRASEMGCGRVDRNDLIQAGYIGLMRAIDEFDLNSGNRLTTYARFWVDRYIRVLQETMENPRIPRYKREEMMRYQRAVRSLRERLGREPTLEEKAREYNDSVEAVRELEDYISGSHVPVDTCTSSYSENGDVTTLAMDETFDDRLMRKELARTVVDWIHENCTERNAQIVLRRFNGEVLKSIADDFDLSRERVRQIEEQVREQILTYCHDEGYEIDTMDELHPSQSVSAR